MNEITNTLIERLEGMGLEKNVIPGFIRILANALLRCPQTGLSQVNSRLHFLGWDDFDLDYHTLELAIACFEAEGLKKITTRSGRWFEDTFSAHEKAAEKPGHAHRTFKIIHGLRRIG